MLVSCPGLAQQVLQLALLQRLPEAGAEGEVGLGLAATDEVADLRGAGTRHLRSWGSWRGRGSCSWGRASWGRLVAAAAAEHAGEGVAGHVTHGGAHRHASSSGRHLSHQAWLLRSRSYRCSYSCGSCCYWGRSSSWGSSWGRSSCSWGRSSWCGGRGSSCPGSSSGGRGGGSSSWHGHWSRYGHGEDNVMSDMLGGGAAGA